MPGNVTYDKDGSQIPNEGFLNLLIMALRKCEMETGMHLVEYLESFEENDENMEIDAYNDNTLRIAIRKYKDKLYPPPESPPDLDALIKEAEAEDD